MISLALNGQDVFGVRLVAPANGPWVADVELELGVSGRAPEGRVTLTIGTDVLVGTIDPRGTGRVGQKAAVRVVAGAGGWDKLVPAQHLHNDAGVTSTAVYTVTAAAVGEAVADPSPRRLGVDYVRAAGPASRVLRGAAWHVDAAGVTQVAPWPPRAQGDVRILAWDPLTRRAELAADGVVWPGTTLVDSRFDSATIRDVEASFSASGSKVTAWCETGSATGGEAAGNKLARALGLAAVAAVRPEYLRPYAYRVVLQSPVDGRVKLQLVSSADAVPAFLDAVSVWPGVAGVSLVITPGTVVLVAFVGGDPSRPVVVGFDGASPTPERINVGAGTSPVVLASPQFKTWMTRVTTVAKAIDPSIIEPTDYASGKLFSE